MKAVFCLTLVCWLGCSFCPAAAEPDRIQRRQEQIQQRMDERQREREAEFRRRNDSSAPGLELAPLPDEPVSPGAPCADINTIDVEGATLLPPRVVRRVTERYAHRCLSMADINNLLRDMTNAYIERGYVTARVFARPGEQGPGRLSLLAVEGSLEKILLRDGHHDDLRRLRTAFPGLEGKPLNLRDIEQGLDQLNRLPSCDATIDLAPGEAVGGSVMYVELRPSRTWRFGAGIDNLGQSDTGTWQGSAFLEKDNALGLGDQWALSASRDMLFFSPGMAEENVVRGSTGEAGSLRHGSYSLSLYGSLPLGYWTFFLSAGRSCYQTSILGQNYGYAYDGATDTLGLEASRVVHRNAVGKTSVGLALGVRHVVNDMDGLRLTVSSYQLTTLTVSLRHSRTAGGGAFSAQLEYTRGLPWLGATADTGGDHDRPRAGFDKVFGRISWYRPFAWGGHSLYGDVSAVGQMSGQTLYGAERLSLGSLYTVRGFREHSLSGENGGYVRVECGWNLPWPERWRQGPVSGLQVFGAYDAGVILKDPDDPFERGRLQGVSAGLRTTGKTSLNLTLSRALSAPSFMRPLGTELYMSFRHTF